MDKETNDSQPPARERSTLKLVIGIICFIVSAFFLLGFIGALLEDAEVLEDIIGQVVTLLITVVAPFVTGTILVFKR